MAINEPLLCSVWRRSGALMLVALLAGCGGGSGPSNLSPNPGQPPGPSPTTVNVSGKITFDRIPFDATLGEGLNPSAPVESSARGVVVEAISGGAVVASTTTNATGDYSFAVPGNTEIFIRAKAQMLKSGAAPTWDFKVLNNTNADALYVLDGSSFNTGTADSTRNLRAPSGWTGSSYGQTRAAAPFAVLDTVYQATNLIVGAAPSIAFEPLNLYWSANNRSGTVDQQGNPIFCIDDGDILTTSYVKRVSTQATDDCGDPILPGIYVLGAVQQGSGGSVGDTDEFDQHVIAHEFGHYIEHEFSRSDSIGGDHGDGDRLDPRVAFGEGWGNAFAGMVLNEPLYRDSYAVAANEFGFDMESDAAPDGWFSEASIAEILWDLFDTTNESGDSASLGFGPIFAALTDGQRTTDALTSIFSFLEALREEASGQGSAIDELVNGENISVTDEFGTNETDDGGDPSVLPLYRPIQLNSGQPIVCVRATGTYPVNKLGYNKFFRLDLATAALVTIFVAGDADVNTENSQPAIDPDVYVYRQGEVVASAESTGPTDTTGQVSLSPATYIIEVLDFDLATGDPPRCMTISVTG